MHKTTSKQFLNHTAEEYYPTIVKGWEGLYKKKRNYLYEILKPYFVSGSALEFGCADGVITRRMCEDFEHVVVVEGSITFIRELKKQIKAMNLNFINALFEEFTTSRRFNTIFMTHILEHLDSPVDFLSRSRDWLTSNGRLLVAVPNANSLHRLVGVELGILERQDDFNEGDRLIGHKRVYTPQLFWQHLSKAGFRIIRKGGCMLKPLTNRQIEANWTRKLVDAFFAVGEDMPELCSEIYVVAEVEGGIEADL